MGLVLDIMGAPVTPPVFTTVKKMRKISSLVKNQIKKAKKNRSEKPTRINIEINVWNISPFEEVAEEEEEEDLKSVNVGEKG